MNPQPTKLTLDAPGVRLDLALKNNQPDVSRVRWFKLIKSGHVTVNGNRVKPSYLLKGDETVEVVMPETLETDIVAEDIPLDIAYEDRDILVVNKPAGMVVHPAPGHYSGTLVNAILGYCPDIAGIGGEKRPGIVHRLDKETSGLIVVAKNDKALHFLQDQFRARTVKKQYLALVEDVPGQSTATIDAPIGRDPKQRKRMAVIRPGSSATSRPAQTLYNIQTAYTSNNALVECWPHTGRTHQIRVHMAFIGHPLVGDRVYGRRKQRLPLNRHFLHAAGISFQRPSDKETLTLTNPLPPDLQELLDTLKES